MECYAHSRKCAEWNKSLVAKIIKIFSSFLLFSIYPGTCGYLLLNFGTIYLLFLPVIIALLLFLGWGMYGQKFESKNQSSIVAESPFAILIFWPSFLFIKNLRALRHKEDISTSPSQSIIPIEKFETQTNFSENEINSRLSSIIATNFLIDTSKAFRGSTNSKGFDISSNINHPFQMNTHTGKYIRISEDKIKIRIESKFNIILLILVLVLFLVGLVYSISVIISLLRDGNSSFLKFIVSGYLILFSLLLYHSNNRKRNRELELICETLRIERGT